MTSAGNLNGHAHWASRETSEPGGDEVWAEGTYPYLNDTPAPMTIRVCLPSAGTSSVAACAANM